MGAHYRSLQVRNANRDAIISAAESLVRSGKGRLLIGPDVNGWIGIYPNDAAPAEKLALAISKAPNITVLELMVHDSDVFYYNLYRGGKLVDEYSSCPDYFEEVPAADHERLKGKPDTFRDLLASPGKLEQLKSLLDSREEEQFVFEEERLRKFAALFGIKNSLTSYDYLTDGESEGVAGRNRFVHIPDLTAEKAAAKAARAALRAEVTRLKREGILCFEAAPAKKSRHVMADATFDPGDGNLLFCQGTYFQDGSEPQLFRLQPPWTSKPEVVEIPPSAARIHNLRFSRTGRWFAYRDSQLRLWDWPDGNLISEVQGDSIPLHFSPDEKSLLLQNKLGFELLSLETKKIVQSIRTHPHFLAWHPSGRFIVSRVRQEQLGLIDLEAGKVVKVLYSGTVCDWSSLASFFSGTLQKAGVSESQLRDCNANFIRGSDQPFNLKFSPDGKLLFCATTRGLRVLEWEKVLAAEKCTPEPLFAASPFPLESPMKPAERKDSLNYVYDVVHDEPRNRLLFAGIEGAIRYFNLDDGRTGVLFKPPGKDCIYRMHLSPDREFLCCLCTPPVEERNGSGQCIRVWNYRLLRNAAGLD